MNWNCLLKIFYFTISLLIRIIFQICWIFYSLILRYIYVRNIWFYSTIGTLCFIFQRLFSLKYFQIKISVIIIKIIHVHSLLRFIRKIYYR